MQQQKVNIGERRGGRVIVKELPSKPRQKVGRRIVVRCDCGHEDTVSFHEWTSGRVGAQCRHCLRHGYEPDEVVADWEDPVPGRWRACPASGCHGCRHYLPRYRLCVLDAVRAYGEGMPEYLIAELFGLVPQTIQIELAGLLDSLRARTALMRRMVDAWEYKPPNIYTGV